MSKTLEEIVSPALRKELEEIEEGGSTTLGDVMRDGAKLAKRQSHQTWVEGDGETVCGLGAVALALSKRGY